MEPEISSAQEGRSPEQSIDTPGHPTRKRRATQTPKYEYLGTPTYQSLNQTTELVNAPSHYPHVCQMPYQMPIPVPYPAVYPRHM